jgi:hypothetical protein
MKRLAVVLVFAIGFGGIGSGAPAEAHHRPGPASIHWHQRWVENRDTRPVRALIWRAAVTFGISPSKALAVADCETGGTFAPNAGIGQPDDYRGIFQHDRDYWPGRVRAFTKPWWHLRPGIFNARTQAVVSARMVAEHGWGAWTCA